MSHIATSKNVSVLANATELSFLIIKKIEGNNAGVTVEGEKINNIELKSAIVAKIQSSLVSKTGVL